jgi:hypothetical protein
MYAHMHVHTDVYDMYVRISLSLSLSLSLCRQGPTHGDVDDEEDYMSLKRDLEQHVGLRSLCPRVSSLLLTLDPKR